MTESKGASRAVRAHNSEHICSRRPQKAFSSRQLRQWPSCLLSSGSGVRVPPDALSVSPRDLPFWHRIVSSDVVAILHTLIPF